jgi:hypothetical protein
MPIHGKPGIEWELDGMADTAGNANHAAAAIS